MSARPCGRHQVARRCADRAPPPSRKARRLLSISCTRRSCGQAGERHQGYPPRRTAATPAPRRRGSRSVRASATSGVSMREPARGEVARVLGLRVDPDARRRRQARAAGRARRAAPPRPAPATRISSNVGISNCPSKRVLAGRTCGMRSRARRVLSSASVKSSVNQPSTSRAIDAAARAAAGELRARGDIGGAADLVLVTRHQHPVARS